MEKQKARKCPQCGNFTMYHNQGISKKRKPYENDKCKCGYLKWYDAKQTHYEPYGDDSDKPSVAIPVQNELEEKKWAEVRERKNEDILKSILLKGALDKVGKDVNLDSFVKETKRIYDELKKEFGIKEGV